MKSKSLIRVVGSSSYGNSYILECQNETLLLELGVSFDRIKRALDFDLSRVSGCLVTHQHSDHSKSIGHALKYGLEVYSCQEVVDKIPQVSLLEKGKKTRIGGFVVQPIPVSHSCECYSFLIEHEALGRLLFVTDCSSFPYRIKNLNHILMEANYSNQTLIKNLCEDSVSRSLYQYHMEIEDTIESLKNNYSPSLQNVVLLHLSCGNSNEKKFIHMVKKGLGFDNVFVAKAGLHIDLQKEEF